MKRFLAIWVVSVVLLGASVVANAGDRWSVSIGGGYYGGYYSSGGHYGFYYNSPGVYYAPSYNCAPRYYCPPAPTYYYPSPTVYYYSAPPVYYAPAPTYYVVPSYGYGGYYYNVPRCR
jgi:hypothetical protein